MDPAVVDSGIRRFTTAEQLFQDIDETPRDILRIHDVTPEDLARIEKMKIRREGQYRWKRYLAEVQLLIVSCRRGAHECLHIELWEHIILGIRKAGLTSSWQPLGAATFRPPGRYRDVGEPDSSGRPLPLHEAHNWPTLVIESGVSESLVQLREDAKWWFRVSNHSVKIVLLAHADVAVGRITVDKWIEVPDGTGRVEPYLDQEIIIPRTAPGMRPWATPALRLELPLMFLRNAEQGERDIEVGTKDLQAIASQVWYTITRNTAVM